ncbi:hypothetical protein K525DRAFT_361843 [Schizophyllum commune Loenen D]|nr:hypothetical protein K525DRAFT_361843 [Schizophyllum commune Loenen D]
MARKKAASPPPSPTRKSHRLAAIRGDSQSRAPSTPGIKNRAYDAARREHRAREMPLRKSARIRNLPPGSTPASTGSTPSPPPSRHRPTARKHATPYTPERVPGIDLDTPRNRIRWGDSRPTAASLAKVSLSGTDSALSGASREMGIPIIHHADRKIKSEELRKMEIALGEDQGKLNLDTRGNLMPVEASIHTAYDAGLIVFSPTIPDLIKLYTALVDKEVSDWNKERPPHKNAQGFIHHEDVFPLDGTGRRYHIVPTKKWHHGSHISIKADGDSVARPYSSPFVVGQPPLPNVTIHCSPYFVVYKAYWAMIYKDAVLPPYMANEEQLIRDIGQILTGKVIPPLPKA